MGSVYRRERLKGGKRVRDKKHTISFRGIDGKWHTEPGYTDKKASEEKLRKIELRIARQLEGLPCEAAAPVARPILEAVQLYAADLRRQGRSADHAARRVQQLTDASAWCSWSTVASVTAESATAFLVHLEREGVSRAARPVTKTIDGKQRAIRFRPRVSGPTAPQTVNHYLTSLKCFCSFAVRQKWLAASPLAGIPKANLGSPGDVSRRPQARRALSLAEYRGLAGCLDVRLRRRNLYQCAALSGLRAKELHWLAPVDFTLGARPQFHLRPEVSKGKRLDRVPMLPECAELLTRLSAGLGPYDRLFPLRPHPDAVLRDYAKAGVRAKDERGRRAGFHSLRCTFATVLAEVLPIQVVSRLMRHRSIEVTNALYIDLGLTDMAEKLDTLPPLFTTDRRAAPLQPRTGSA